MYLAIAQPCHADWAQMTPTEQGRYCQSCRKEVLDFSSMDPSAILRVVQQAPEGSVCGRLPAQVLLESRQQALALVPARPTPARWPGAVRQWLATLSLPLLASSPLLARPAVVVPAVAEAALLPRSRPATLQLRVYDPATGQGLGFATVQLWLADSLLLTAQAEADGTLQLALPHQTAPLRLLVEAPGYQAAEEFVRPEATAGALAIPLQRGATELPVVWKEAEAPQERRVMISGGISSVAVIQEQPHPAPQGPRKWPFWRRVAKPAPPARE